jgi:Transposase IS66 family
MWYTVFAETHCAESCELAHMKHTTKAQRVQLQFWHGLVLLSLLTLALLGRPPDSQAGWLLCPPRLVYVPGIHRRRQATSRSVLPLAARLRNVERYVIQSWPQPMVRSLLLTLLWSAGARRGPMALVGWPWLLWLWQVAAAGWPELSQRSAWRAGGWLVWQGQRLLLLGYASLALEHLRPVVTKGWTSQPPTNWLLVGLGCQQCGREEPWVEVTRQADGGYQATLCGHFTLSVAGDDPVRARLLMVFLRQLETAGPARGSRRTRDGRTPFVRQVPVAQWFGLPRPDVSRIEGYWQQGAWPEMLSQCTAEILTPEVVRRVVTACATFPQWSQEQVYRYVRQQGLAVSQRQVRQAMAQSGWSTLRHELLQRYDLAGHLFRFRDEWLVQDLLCQLQRLQACLETGQHPSAEEQLTLADLQTFIQEVGIESHPPLKAVPWLLRLERVLWGEWEMVEDGTIRCPNCGSAHVGRKSRQPRPKKFYDAQGKLQEMAVYRYYCHNRACKRHSFTHLPPGLVPYSRHRGETHLLACQAYAWGYSTYRRVGQALQVGEMTVYRWVSAWGYDLLPVAAIFGLVRSSGVVGVDEKYVLVPKNDKPAGKMRRWMYVYLAVDVYTYDLLHIAIYAHNTSESAQAFLLALRAKGYRPRVVVTDLRRDYGPVIAQVFPKAQHHECLFHAEQEIGRYLQKMWGRHYAEQQPEAEQLRAAIVKMLQARTKRTAHKCYQALLAQRQEYVEQALPLQWVFDFLEQHWPYLVNAIESELIPATNNAVEMVIRRFDQHYQNFCGFESVETAQVYLGVFEKIYRFTPFSNDAQPTIRGKSPLQLAGYDVSRMPMTALCNGWSLDWPATSEAGDVPKR